MGGVMERNRRETALRCLEIAVHPHTKDEEVIAAINGFRRTVAGTPLNRLYQEFAGAGPVDAAAELQRLSRENLELRRKIEEAEAGRTAALRRVEAAEQNAREITEELLAAEHRADTAEQQLAEIHSAPNLVSGGWPHDDPEMRRALAEARRNLTQPIHEPVRPFQNMLNAALGRADQAPPALPTPASSHPWTA
jgi:hypothetical protein